MPSGPVLCGGCKARVTFVTVTRRDGRTSRMILDDRPDPAGNVAVRASGQSKIGRVLPKNARPDSDETMYMPHRATCPRPPPGRAKPAAPAARPAAPQPATIFDT